MSMHPHHALRELRGELARAQALVDGCIEQVTARPAPDLGDRAATVLVDGKRFTVQGRRHELDGRVVVFLDPIAEDR